MDEFLNNGYRIVPFEEESDVCVINTCTVTAKTEYKCRQIFRKAQKTSPHATIAVVGCYAQMALDQNKPVPYAHLLLGSDQKFEIISHLKNNHHARLKSANDSFVHTKPGLSSSQTRAFLKIQDGCNNFCSYCIVPLVRGKSRSNSINNILEQAKQLTDFGFKEIVLTGVHIGRYGIDLTPPLSLAHVLTELTKLPKLSRIRLSSLEPLEISDDLIDIIAQSPKICPHFHVPLQSGDDVILKKMNRNYAVSAYAKIIKKISAQIPSTGLGTDIIVGFPGETNEQYQNTYDLVNKLPFSYLHVFTYSPRPGTRAALLPNQINSQIKKERSAKLIELGKIKKKHFYQQAVNNQFDVLFESKQNGQWMYGFTENYIRLKASLRPEYFNQIVPVKIYEISGEHAVGEILQME